MSNQWYFPESNGLGINGASDGGLETFKGNLMGSLTREICQNSLDASFTNDAPVRIVFKSSKIKTSDIPGIEKLREVFKGGYRYWKQNNNKKAIKFYEKGMKELNSLFVSILRISDFNTTGLTGSKSNGISPWLSMVLAEGVSDKNGSSGGSYGIGKSSIYAVSNLHCAFFNTYDKDRIRACQGVAKLPSFMLEDKIRFGKGYYGGVEEQKCNCCESIDKINQIFKRKEQGTDIFIMGFNETSSWKDKIVCSLLDNFLLAIYNNKLVVEIDDIIVNQDTLPSLLEKHNSTKEVESARKYYDVLSSDIKTIPTQLFPDLKGLVTLKVKLFRENANRSVLISRSNGMKLFDRKNISSSIQFSAILTMHGDELNEYFAKMENPAHNDWEPDRYEDENLIEEATNKCKQLYKWIKDTILEIGEEFYGDEVDIEGLEGILPEFYDMGTKGNESLTNRSKNISTKKRKKKNQSLDIKTIDNGESLFEIETTGILDPNGELESKSVPVNPDNASDNGDGGPAEATNGDGNRPIREFKPVNNFSKRIFVSNVSSSEYTLVLKTNQSLSDCRLSVQISGETSNVRCNITEAFNVTTNQKLTIKENKIYLNRIAKGFQYKIRFKIDTPYICSLGVQLYANH